MNRQEKAQVVQALKSEFQNSEAAFVIDYKGLSVSQVTDLRKRLRPKNGLLQVAKITLMKLALKDLEVEPLSSLLENQVAVIFARQETTAVAKTICDFSQEFAQVKILGGAFESSLLSKDQVKAFASIPSREILHAKLCGVLQAPISKFVYVLHAQLVQLLLVLKQIEKQKMAQ